MKTIKFDFTKLKGDDPLEKLLDFYKTLYPDFDTLDDCSIDPRKVVISVNHYIDFVPSNSDIRYAMLFLNIGPSFRNNVADNIVLLDEPIL